MRRKKVNGYTNKLEKVYGYHHKSIALDIRQRYNIVVLKTETVKIRIDGKGENDYE